MILFITRKYPPSVGGMENALYELSRHLAPKTDLKIIAWGRSQRGLPLFAIIAFIQAIVASIKHKPQCIYVGDIVLAPLAIALRFFLRVPIFATAHGLDVTFTKSIYPRLVRFSLKRLDGVICVSNYTRSECLQRGAKPDRCVVIHWGVTARAPLDRSSARKRLQEICPVPLLDRKILLTVGRLVQRKGVVWFVREVLPDLVKQQPNVLYLIVGEGAMREAIENEIKRMNLNQSAYLLGRITEEMLLNAYASADVFVMPNISVAGNPEGFGLVSLETRAVGTPVVAANLEGVCESIEPGVDGLIVESGHALEFTQAIESILAGRSSLIDRDQIRSRAMQIADWSAVADRYLAQFNQWLKSVPQ